MDNHHTDATTNNTV